MRLSDSLSPAQLKTTGPFLEELSSAGIRTAEDLLLYLPRAYEDLSRVTNLVDAPENEKVTVRGTIAKLRLVRTRSKKTLVQGQFVDETGATAEVVWFNQPHVMRMLKEGQVVTLTGKVIEEGYKLKLQSPIFEDANRPQQLHAGRIVAVYPQTERITSRWLREKIALIKKLTADLPETLPEEVVRDEKLLSRAEAIEELHFPTTPEKLEAAKHRMAFEEIFRSQVEAIERKKLWQGKTQERLKIPMDIELIKAFFACQKFTPTDDQRVAIYEILKDMERDRPMSRLLEGDVGSGKTLVAVAVTLNAIVHGGQVAFMVPTEVLAKQHVQTVTRLLLDFHSFIQRESYKEKNIDAGHLKSMRQPTIALLTGSVPTAEAQDVRKRLATGQIDVVIGTHALIEDSVQFKDLRLAIVDEQHRFGVMQREKLKEKGAPHFLSMTATPIPRTLALTAYGDHDLSLLLHKPGQRKKIITKVVSPSNRHTVELFIDSEIEAGRQVYVICPLITESKADEILDVKNVEMEVARLTEEFPKRNIGRLHGKLTPQEKTDIMRDFKEKKYDILVSTSVIEVGIDVPNTTVIVIEGAERFGLSQLHQFRGRVGRSDHQSYCYLFTTSPEQARSERLKAMEQHDSGFMLAEVDLRLRGPGELFGTKQSGVPEFRFANLLNVELLVRARKAAEKMLHM